jgi:molecular chaperone DnaK
LHELVQARNGCDNMIHSVQKSLKEYGDKISADDKAKIEAALKDAEGVVKSDNKEEIEAKTQRWPRLRTSCRADVCPAATTR